MPFSLSDYIIGGGGTAGLVVAARLSEDPQVSVVVLEAGAGRLDDPRVNTPAFWASLIGTDLDWQFETVSQIHSPSFLGLPYALDHQAKPGLDAARS